MFHSVKVTHYDSKHVHLLYVHTAYTLIIDRFQEANFSFYKQAAESYGCCDSLEKFEFPVFKPVTIERGEDQLNKNPLYEENFYPAIIRRHDANYPPQQEDDDLALPNPQEYNIRFFDEDDQDIPGYS